MYYLNDGVPVEQLGSCRTCVNLINLNPATKATTKPPILGNISLIANVHGQRCRIYLIIHVYRRTVCRVVNNDFDIYHCIIMHNIVTKLGNILDYIQIILSKYSIDCATKTKI